jgi:hypothetical protein
MRAIAAIQFLEQCQFRLGEPPLPLRRMRLQRRAGDGSC